MCVCLCICVCVCDLTLAITQGLHVTVPLTEPLQSFDSVHTFARFLAEQLGLKYPDKIVAHKNEDRAHRVFIDYIRNFRGATSICPYSPRANPSATVAVPISWDEFPDHTAPNQYDIHTVRARLEKLRASGADPWKDIFTHKQALTAHAMDAVLHDLP
jgi:bifunctional non-homologous end joining protein LigD